MDSRVFISLDFLTDLPLSCMHFLHQSSHYLKVTVNLSVSMPPSDDPFPGFLEALWSQHDASQLPLHPAEQEVVARARSGK